MLPASTDVLIVGAGPVGLMLACHLQRHGVSHLLIDRMAERSYFCKALGVTPRSLELFEDLGIADRAIDRGLWLTTMTSFANGVETDTRARSAVDLPYGFLALPQYETERILEGCLNDHGGSVRYGVALDSLTQDETGVTARVADAGGAVSSIACRWLVGCDGGRSVVRHQCGLPFEGGSYPMTFMLCDVELDWNLPRGRAYRFTQLEDGTLTNALAAIPVHGSPRRYRLSTAMPESIGSDAPPGTSLSVPSLDRLTEVLVPMLPPGTVLSALRWSSVYRISHRIVPSYAVGRVFLAGDAAHIHPPVGGQGMNTGLQDAHGLAWRLVLAARGLAAPDLLDGYSAERHPVGREVVEQTSRAMNDLFANRPEQQDPTMRESQLFIHHRDSPWVVDEVAEEGGEGAADGPRAGDRAPDADGLTRPGVARSTRLRERIGRGAHLLVAYAQAAAGRADYEAFADLFERLRQRFGELCDGLVVTAPDAEPVDLERIPLLTDATGVFGRVYAARNGMVWLIRPDGHIGLRLGRPDPGGLERYCDRILGASPAPDAGAQPEGRD